MKAAHRILWAVAAAAILVEFAIVWWIASHLNGGSGIDPFAGGVIGLLVACVGWGCAEQADIIASRHSVEQG